MGARVPSFAASYLERLAVATDAYEAVAREACLALGLAIPSTTDKMSKLLSKAAADLNKRSPAWMGCVIYEKLGTVQVAQDWTAPNVEVVFEHDMTASLIATRTIPRGEVFHLEETMC